MKAPLSATQSVNQNHFFSKTADRIFMIFHLNFCFLKDKKVIQPGKNLILGNRPFSSYKRKCSRPIRLLYFLSFNIIKTIRGIKFLF